MGFGFPAVAGNEGVGIVEQLGEDVTSVNDRDTVLLVKPTAGMRSVLATDAQEPGASRSSSPLTA